MTNTNTNPITETAAETVVEETETGETIQYEIVDGDIDGNKVRGVRANGNLLYTVSGSFTNEQIQETFNLNNKFFNDGVRFGAGQVAARYKQNHDYIMSLVIEPPAAEEAGEATLDTEE